MQKSANRVFSLLLAFVMILSLLPASVFATGETGALEGWNIALGDDIGVRFHLSSADYTVSVTVNGVGVTPAISGDVVTVNVAAAQMNDPIVLTVKSGEEVVHTGEYSVRGYADTILSGNYGDEVKAMVKQMLNYGAAAQTYFKYNTGALANSGITVDAATVPTEVPQIEVSDTLAGIGLYGASLLFQNKTAVRFYFSCSGNITDYTFKVGEHTCVPVAKDGLYYVEIGNIHPQALDKDIILSVNDGALTVTYSPMDYILRQYNKAGSSDSLKALMQAMYGYHKEALKYIEYVEYQEYLKIVPTEGNVLELHFDKIRETAPMTLITKKTYPAGTTITFKAYQPYITDMNNNWWGIGLTTDLYQGDVYASASNTMYNPANDDKWAEYSYTIPAGTADSYIFIGGAISVNRENFPLLIDDVVITTPDGNAVSDGFEYGADAVLFNVNSDAGAVQLRHLSTATAAEALDALKAQYGEAVTDGTELISSLWIKGHEFTVAWTTQGASVSDGKLSAIAQNAEQSYTLTATVSKDGDSASHSWSGVIAARTGIVAEIPVDKLVEGAPAGFISKNAYAGGSTVSFEAYVPANTSWWGVCYTTDPSNVSLYNCFSAPTGQQMSTQADKWAQYSLTLPADSNNYYIYIVGAKGEWNGNSILVDNVTITTGSTSVTDTFEGESLFNLNGYVRLYTLGTEPGSGNYAAIYVDQLNEAAPMSFITKAAYPGGSTVIFDAYVPSNTSWWGVSYTTDPSNANIYTCFDAATGQQMSTQADQWAQYSLTLPADSNNYYIYIVGAKGEWNGNIIRIDNVTITKGDAYIDNFEGESLFDINAGAELNTPAPSVTAQDALDDMKAHYGDSIAIGTQLPATWTVENNQFNVSWTAQGASVSGGKLSAIAQNAEQSYTLTATVSKDGDSASHSWSGVIAARTGIVAEIPVDKLVEGAPAGFISKNAYAGGSTVSFEAYVPANTSWWGVCYTTDPSNVSLYNCFSAPTGQQMSTQADKWAQYSLTLPADSNNYYIYIVGAKGEWNGNSILVDNVTITTGSTSVTDTFEGESLFNLNGYVRLYTLGTEPGSGNYAAIYVDQLNEAAPMSFITKAAYPGGSTVIFDAYVPSNTSWWGVSYTTDPSNANIYTCFDAATGQQMSTQADQWAQYSLTLPADSNNYYIYIVGAKGEWNGNIIRIDNVTITKGDAYIDNFEGESLFDINAGAELIGTVVTAQDALKDMKAYYGDSIEEGTELPSTWTVDGKEFAVQWSVSEGTTVASVQDGTLKLAPQSTTVNYLLQATVSNGNDTASYSWIDNVAPESNYYAVLSFNAFNEGGVMNFITKNAYPAGTTISFNAYQPSLTDANNSWWGIGLTTDPNNGDLYNCATHGMRNDGNNNKWASYQFTIPEGTADSHIFIGGAINAQWAELPMLIDDVVITMPGGTSVTDGFDGNSLFNMGNGVAIEADEPEEVTPMAGNYAAVYVDYLSETAPMSFMTKQAYPGGSTIRFQAFVPNEATWWTVNWTTDPNQGDLYVGFSGQGQDMSGASQKGRWAQYSVTLPNDGNSYYIYVVGAKGEWGVTEAKGGFAQPLLIDDVTITAPDGTQTAESFEGGLDSSIFNYDAISAAGDTVVELQTYNYGQAVQVQNLLKGISFISKTAFPAGSTVSFDAKVPESHDWWSLNWTTDPGTVNNEDARYVAYSGMGTVLSSFEGKWSNYTVTLPSDGGPYHIYLAGPGEWTESLLVDNVKIVSADGTVLAEENFNHSIADSIFVTDAAAASMCEIIRYTETETAEIQFAAYAAPTDNGTVGAPMANSVGAAYRKMADAGFNKAIALTEGLSGSVTATDKNEIKAQIAERSAYVAQIAEGIMKKAAQFGMSYYVKDWSLYNMGGSSTDEHGVSDDFGLTQSDFNDIYNSIFASGNIYSGNAGYAGHFGYDEPKYADMETVGWATDAYKASGAGGDLLVNLLPNYSTLPGGLFNTYEDYVQRFLDVTAGDLDYISWDYYPFRTNAITNKHIENYLPNYELMARLGKENNRELRVIIQSAGDSHGVKDIDGKSELSFQIYTGLCFGVKEFTYYVYSGKSTTGYKYIYNCDTGTYNEDLYNWTKAVNNDVHSFEEVYDEYTWSNVMKVGSNEMLDTLENATTSNDKLSVSGNGAYLVGVFHAKDSGSTRQNAFVITNANYDTNASAEDVTLTFAGASAVAIWRNGEQTVVKLNNNQLVLNDVQPGEGVFAVPLYN